MVTGEVRRQIEECRMNNMARCDFTQLERTVTSQFRCGAHSVHGPTHWRRVERNGIWLARRSQASEMVATNGLFVNATSIAASYTIQSGYNAQSVGPVTIASGQSVTITSGQRWLVY